VHFKFTKTSLGIYILMCDLKTGTAKSSQDKPTKSNLTGVIDYVYEYYLAMY